MVVNVQCPHCGSLCQVDLPRLGATVKCGKCTRPFRVPAAPPTAEPMPVATAPLPRPSAETDGGSSPAGVQSAPRTVKMSVKPSVEEEITVILDGPAAAALAPPPQTSTAAPAVVARLEVGSATSAGRVRKRNEDSFLAQHLSSSHLDQRCDLALVVVADGVGGHEAGDQASALVIHHFGRALGPLLGSVPAGPNKLAACPPSQAGEGRKTGFGEKGNPVRLAEAIHSAFQESNRAIYECGQREASGRGMAATACVAVVWEGQVQVGHVGDCRAYHAHAGTLTQVTRDQTLAQRMVDLGQLTPQEALTHPARAEVIQAIGGRPNLTPAAHQLRLAPGDWLIVASDGLHTHLEHQALQEAVRRSPLSAAALAHDLVELADREGGMDNCTVVVVRAY